MLPHIVYIALLLIPQPEGFGMATKVFTEAQQCREFIEPMKSKAIEAGAFLECVPSEVEIGQTATN